MMKKEVRTSIDGLQAGMFVSRLDRPWIKTPFDLEGFMITSGDDIERLRRYCNYVYVDVEQGSAPHPRYWILGGGPKAQAFETPQQSQPLNADSGSASRSDEIRALSKTTYGNTTPFEREIRIATQTSEKLSKDHNRLLKDLAKGRNIDLTVVKRGVTDMVESVIRNPSAMMWIAQLKGLDRYTYSRALGTSVWCATFGRHLGLEKEDIRLLALGGLLLDIGKSHLPVELVKKHGELSLDELTKMRAHVDLGVKILVASVNRPDSEKTGVQVFQMVATHHERADGSGYPQSLTNDEIPLFGRIAGIVDSYDAMTSDRPYMATKPLSPHEAITELYELRGSRFQAELVEQFIQAVGLYPTGSLVELSTGEVGAVVGINGLRRLQPTLMLLLDKNKEPYANFSSLDLSTAPTDIRVKRGLPPGAYGIDMQELFL